MSVLSVGGRSEVGSVVLACQQLTLVIQNSGYLKAFILNAEELTSDQPASSRGELSNHIAREPHYQ